MAAKLREMGVRIVGTLFEDVYVEASLGEQIGNCSSGNTRPNDGDGAFAHGTLL